MTHRRPHVALHIILLVLAAIAVYPIVFMLTNALKDGLQTAANPFSFPIHPLWANFMLAWQATAGAYLRSAIIVSVSTAAILTFSLMSAYVFARLNFPERDALFYVIFGLLLVPGFLHLIPLFLEIKDLHLMNSIWGIILPYTASQAFAIFVLRTFVKTLPEELFESARLDGASDLHVFLRIVAPLCVPVLITVGLLTIIGEWSDYVLPSLVLSEGHRTISMAIANFTPPSSAPSLDAFNMQLAAFTLASLPIALLFVFLMKYFVAGITNGALKL